MLLSAGRNEVVLSLLPRFIPGIVRKSLASEMKVLFIFVGALESGCWMSTISPFSRSTTNARTRKTWASSFSPNQAHVMLKHYSRCESLKTPSGNNGGFTSCQQPTMRVPFTRGGPGFETA
ncbi:predicted protein [Coccidioides posadasii str. Silveira]|uniref:Predicted protein n=1 Tax=Coccidioides posadasii (strain RMSCC 757 / Silveira) TaxID=443226 RepID=E9D4F0_COCPS|nr:predicted protein [Coccidioides posadasii str. Silveira]